MSERGFSSEVWTIGQEVNFHLGKRFIGSLKFGLSEKHTKFEKILLMVLTYQLIYLVNVKTIRQIFSNYVCFSKSPNFTLKSLKVACNVCYTEQVTKHNSNTLLCLVKFGLFEKHT